MSFGEKVFGKLSIWKNVFGKVSCNWTKHSCVLAHGLRVATRLNFPHNYFKTLTRDGLGNYKQKFWH